MTAGSSTNRRRAVCDHWSSNVIGQSAPWRHSVVTWSAVTWLLHGWPN